MKLFTTSKMFTIQYENKILYIQMYVFEFKLKEHTHTHTHTHTLDLERKFKKNLN